MATGRVFSCPSSTSKALHNKSWLVDPNLLNRNLPLILAYINKNIQTTELFQYCSFFPILISKCLRKTYVEDLCCFCCKKFSCLSKFIFLTLLLCLCQNNRIELGMGAGHLLLSLLIWQLGDGSIFPDKYTSGEKCDI